MISAICDRCEHPFRRHTGVDSACQTKIRKPTEDWPTPYCPCDGFFAQEAHDACEYCQEARA